MECWPGLEAEAGVHVTIPSQPQAAVRVQGDSEDHTPYAGQLLCANGDSKFVNETGIEMYAPNKFTAYNVVDTYATLCIFHPQSQSLALSVHDGTKLWQSTVAENELKAIAKSTELDYLDYVECFIEAIRSTTSADKLTFTCVCGTRPDLNPSKLLVSWSKVVSDGIKVIYGKFCLSESERTQDLLNFFTQIRDVMCGLQRKLQQLTTDYQRLKDVAEKSLKEYEDVVSEQKKTEHLMLAKFAALLNEKKRRIAELAYLDNTDIDRPVMHRVPSLTTPIESDDEEVVLPVACSGNAKPFEKRRKIDRVDKDCDSLPKLSSVSQVDTSLDDLLDSL